MTTLKEFQIRVIEHLSKLYPPSDLPSLCDELLKVMDIEDGGKVVPAHHNNWDENDIYLITYGDSVYQEGEAPLTTLQNFLTTHVGDSVSSVHILPFYPYSSDDGFSVIDYYQVNQSLGGWRHVEAICQDYDVMADVVINHCSARSGWFENFKNNKHPGKDFFFEADPTLDLSLVVRPRTHDLLKQVTTADGTKYVWCTFSHDQVDFDFRNPAVLIEFVSILKFYLDKGITIFRFDAVAFLWKIPGTSCINLVETHEVVKLLRLLVERQNPDAIIITETNVPNRQNLMYFGNANEAHAIYNFALPPLLINALTTGNCMHLKTWLMSLPPAQSGTTYFNFIASHDGIGLRPVEGLLEETEIDELINTMVNFGGKISWRALKDGSNQVYEINISLIDALSGTNKGKDKYQNQRFICAHTIMLAIEGLPAFYIHSLLATSNDYEKVKHTNQNRSINRHKWDYKKLNKELSNDFSQHKQILSRLLALIDLRKKQPAFHPNATQYTLHLGLKLFAFWRQCPNRKQSIFCINNVSDEAQSLSLADLNLIETDNWKDLIGDAEYNDLSQQIIMAPYQSLWLTNYHS
ncbi:sugar phosphorylase [Thalassotalea crassostreae]|uniref:sugar phosphorylase n=1 Tax=Thalassotalea crassostreae TaxID=1763536 RepID=UPI0008389626|nr:sugar phosphorylase [Thalassotalea crassostreae]